jgi:hypothetical protein
MWDLHTFANDQLERIGSLVSVLRKRRARSPTEPVSLANEGDKPFEQFSDLVRCRLYNWDTDLRVLLRIVWIVFDRVHRPAFAAPRADIRHSPAAGAIARPEPQPGSTDAPVHPTEVRQWTVDFLQGNQANLNAYLNGVDGQLVGGRGGQTYPLQRESD